MNTQLKNKKNSPIYLFRKLGRYIAISTVTGDFYSLTAETYGALEKWSEELLKLETPLSLEISRNLANKYSIPEDIFKLFPLPQRSKIVQGDKDAKVAKAPGFATPSAQSPYQGAARITLPMSMAVPS